ncbi:MAG: DNA replication/repair protein RecF [Alphaproteobacteria bacterium]|nr:DNA replication/repair protein RecF [Alphaproteobacteria bacterium]
MQRSLTSDTDAEAVARRAPHVRGCADIGEDDISEDGIDHDDSRAAAGAGFRRLTLTNFRSYAFADVRFDGRPATFIGANGAGKTNLLEALSMFGPGRGLRSARLDDLARAEGDGRFAVAARFADADGDDGRALGVGIDRTPDGGAARACRLDGATARGPIAFADIVRFSWLTPAQDGLFTAAAGERRRFLDRIAQTQDAGHSRAAADYEAAARQRQRLLDERRGDEAWLSALETRMAEAGVALAAGRRDAATTLASFDVSGLADGAFPAAVIAIEGELEAALDGAVAADVEDAFVAELKARRRRDADAGRATYGPHRSDLIVSHRAKGTLARLCSTGEQKALLIGLVLANACALARRAGAAPLVLLFDEIAAHLDPNRRAALFDIVDGLGLQCFMTGTDESLFASWGRRAQAFRVEGGAVHEI